MRSWPLVLAVSLALLAGCGSDDKKNTEPEPSNYLPQTSIANVIANLKTSYEEMDSEEYAKLFDPSFVYYFAPYDVGGPNNVPPSWGRDDELTSASHMLGGALNGDRYRAEQVQLDFIAGSPESTGVNPNWRKVVLSSIQLNVDSRNEASDVLIYMVSGDKADLYFVQTDEREPGTDQKIWKIVRWDDKPIATFKTRTESTTWGAIKGLWM